MPVMTSAAPLPAAPGVETALPDARVLIELLRRQGLSTPMILERMGTTAVSLRTLHRWSVGGQVQRPGDLQTLIRILVEAGGRMPAAAEVVEIETFLDARHAAAESSAETGIAS